MLYRYVRVWCMCMDVQHAICCESNRISYNLTSAEHNAHLETKAKRWQAAKICVFPFFSVRAKISSFSASKVQFVFLFWKNQRTKTTAYGTIKLVHRLLTGLPHVILIAVANHYVYLSYRYVSPVSYSDNNNSSNICNIASAHVITSIVRHLSAMFGRM